MENFTAFNPVKIHFGKNVIDLLPNEIPDSLKTILIITGKNSSKKYGYLDQIIRVLKNKTIVTFDQIKPNPRIEEVYKAIEVARQNNVDAIVALGGGSVIDSAKMINIAYASGTDPWQIIMGEAKPTTKIPLFVILTLAATGSEMNGAAVIQNAKSKLKKGFFHPLMFPDVSFLDPQFTLTVPENHTRNGLVDTLSHALEAYFACGDAPLTDNFTISVLKELEEISIPLLNNLRNYDLRARHMWVATVALNGTLYHGRKASGDWGVHALAHDISLLFDTPHGETLSIVYPAWLQVKKFKLKSKLKFLAQGIYNKKSARSFDFIDWLKDYFKQIGAPLSLKDIGITQNESEKLLQLWKNHLPQGTCHKNSEKELDEIFKLINE